MTQRATRHLPGPQQRQRLPPSFPTRGAGPNSPAVTSVMNGTAVLTGSIISVGRCRLTLSKPALKAPGTNRLKLKCDKLLSRFGFNVNMRRYTAVLDGDYPHAHIPATAPASTSVGRCRLTVSTAVLKARLVSALETKLC